MNLVPNYELRALHGYSKFHAFHANDKESLCGRMQSSPGNMWITGTDKALDRVLRSSFIKADVCLECGRLINRSG